MARLLVTEARLPADGRGGMTHPAEVSRAFYRGGGMFFWRLSSVG
jgi:hypothetical protein